MQHINQQRISIHTYKEFLRYQDVIINVPYTYENKFKLISNLGHAQKNCKMPFYNYQIAKLKKKIGWRDTKFQRNSRVMETLIPLDTMTLENRLNLSCKIKCRL